jgi:hypothetical protein
MDTTLRTKPLPTLPERRRIVRERLAKAEAELDQFTRLAAGPHFSARAAAAVRTKVRSTKTDIRMLQKALAYLGQPDLRLDLYRLFGVDLPKDAP